MKNQSQTIGKFICLIFWGLSLPTVSWGLVKNLDTRWITKRLADHSGLTVDSDSTLRFLLKPDIKEINDGKRQELTAPKRFENGERVRFEIWTRFPRLSSSGVAKSITVMQWHESMPPGETRRPPLAHRLRGERLVISMWNDDIFTEHGMDGDGLILTSFPVKENVWYKFRYEIFFDAKYGYVSGDIQICTRDRRCNEPIYRIRSGAIGLGYQDAVNYYLKFGAYTTLPMHDYFKVDHYIQPYWIIKQ